MARIYGTEIKTPRDITIINSRIKGDARRARKRSRLTELKRRSRYLLVLMNGPALRKRSNIKSLKKRAKKEYRKTAKFIEGIRERKGIKGPPYKV